jgi:hypothetical protein
VNAVARHVAASEALLNTQRPAGAPGNLPRNDDVAATGMM